MQNSKIFSIVIVNYKSEPYLERCLASIYTFSESEKFEIILVNNDKSADLQVLKDRYPEIEILQSEKNIGFGVACNLGARRAQGKFLFFLNPDTQLLNNYLETLEKEFKKNEKVGVIGPKLMTEKDEIQQWCAGKTVSIRQIIKNNLGFIENKEIWESEKKILTDWVSGAALSIRKKLFDEVRGFDENFFTYFEDDDLCWRVRLSGYDVLYNPEGSILHIGGASWNNVWQKKTQFFKSLAYYLKKKAKSF